MKKYELAYQNDDGLYRIRALRDIPRYGIKAGELGGWAEFEKNLKIYKYKYALFDVDIFLDNVT